MPALLLGSISTVADTSELQRKAFNDAFAQHGLDWTWEREEYAQLLTGNGGRDRIADYAAQRGDTVDADAVHATKSELFQASLADAGLRARPGVVETMRSAKEAGFKVAMVTTTSRANLEALDAALGEEFNLSDLDLVVDTDSVQTSKPDPASYAFALDQLEEQADDCVAVEDNVGGVAAAQAAGVAVVAFPNANTASHDFSAATSVLGPDDAVGLEQLRVLASI